VASLYKQLKEYLPKVASVISDEDTLLLNRRDYHLSQVSSVNATLQQLGISCGYPYRVLLSLLDQFAAALTEKDFNIVLAEPALTLAAFITFVRAGGNEENGHIYAPKGIAKFPEQSGLMFEICNDFISRTNQAPDAKPLNDRIDMFTFVIGTAKTAEQTIFAVDRYVESTKGILILKDYTKIDSADEREYLESKRIYPCMTFEGHALAMKF
jgi:hypothetical protein